MPKNILRQFLQSSTIHGLGHITTSNSWAEKITWMAIVVASFALAISMITSSYKEWQESPVSITLTTHSITELEFPMVTVCPPRGSNTAMNVLLDNIGRVNFSEQDRQELLIIAKKVFIEIPNRKHAKQMMGVLSIENMRSILEERESLPELDEHNVLRLKTSTVETTSFNFFLKYHVMF